MKARIQLLPVFLFALLLIFSVAAVAFASNFVSLGLDNVAVGGQWSQVASIRFMASSSAPLAGVRLYWIIANAVGKAGYTSGTGGRYTYSLRTDVNGQPGAVIATSSMIQNRVTEDQRGNFPLICFPPTQLTVGKYYDIVVENVDPDTYANWSSLDFLWDPSTKNQTPDVQVWISDSGDSFVPADGGTFIGSPVALFYSDGTVQGHGDIAVGSAYPGGFECGSSYGFPAALC